MHKFLFPIIIAALLAACESHTQTTSGKEYLKSGISGSSMPEPGTRNSSFEKILRDVAAVEPTLKFPARIGIARLDQGVLTPMPAEEAQSWKATQEKLGPGFGEFVPLSPLVINMLSDAVNANLTKRRLDLDAINMIRLGAARQHLNAVLIYEVVTKEKNSNNLLALGKLTIIGGFVLPSEISEAEGYATGVLIDVLQGYPYGTIQTAVAKDSALSTAWGWGSDYSDRSVEVTEKVKAKAGKQLADEAYDMFTRLRSELAEKRAKE